MIFEQLQAFRQAIYNSLGPAKDAVFDLMDAVLTSVSISSFVSLSLSPLFRRQWSSAYAAVHKSRPPRNKLMRQYLQAIPTTRQPVFAGDHTAWTRPEAPTLKDRTFEHTGQGSPPVAIGQGYSTLAWIPEASGSWALPLRHERISSFETPLSKAAFQLRQVCRWLACRPLAIYDREYGNASFVQQTHDIAADLLLRLSSNRCLWGAPPPYRGRGAPRKHGDKFKLSNASTWPDPTTTLEVQDPQLGQVQVRHWHRLHFRATPKREMAVVRVEVQVPKGKRRRFQPIWLAWLGETLPPLSDLWHHYLRRFACDHWYRFAKQRLHWTQPEFQDVAATERWSDLMPLMTWQLWLARHELKDHPLPWQTPQDTLSPGRVAQGFAVILAAIGTPAKPPQPRGKSAGWPTGRLRTRPPRYPVVKKRAPKPKRSEQSPNPPPQKSA